MTDIAEKIIQWHASKPQENRAHLGASLVGKACSRQIWYSYRWVKKPVFDGRMLRLFQTGHLAEERMITELKALAGRNGQVHSVGSDGKQFSFSEFGGHFSGSCDGVASNLPGIDGWCLLEFKTHSAKSFEWLEKNKVQVAKPEHYAQMQLYMGEMELPRALYLAVNKNTDALYSEIVEYSPAEFEKLRDKALRIIKSESPPPKLRDTIEGFDCEYCDYQAMCHGDAVPEVNCRTCAHSTPDTEDGGWICEKQQAKPDLELQRKGCDEHLYIPSLINFATAINGCADHVEYEHRDGRTFINSSYAYTFKDPKGYCSSEIYEMGAAVGESVVEKLKADVPGLKVIGFTSIVDIESDDLELAQVKPDAPAIKKKKASIKKTVEAMPIEQGWSHKRIRHV